jgi:hypothetical protein
MRVRKRDISSPILGESREKGIGDILDDEREETMDELGTQGRLVVKRRLHWHRVRQVAMACLPVAVAAFAVAPRLGPGQVEEVLWWIGGVAVVGFVLGLAVLPFYAAARSVVVEGRGPLGAASRLLRREVAFERSVVAVRRNGRRAAIVACGLGVLAVGGTCFATAGADAAAGAVVKSGFVAAMLAVVLVQALSFFVFVKRLSPRQCELAERLLREIEERLGDRVEVALWCELKGYEASARALFRDPSVPFDRWDHEWLVCAVPLKGGSSVEVRVVQHVQAQRERNPNFSIDIWRAELHEEATVELRLDPSLGEAVLRRDEAPLQLAGVDASFTPIEGRTLRARAAARFPAKVTTTDGEVTTGDEGGLLDGEAVWRLIEVCCTGLSISDYRREHQLELLPRREQATSA